MLLKLREDNSKLLTYSSVGIVAAPPTSSAEAIHHRVFRPLARYILNQSLRVVGGFPATGVSLQTDPAG